MAIINTYPTATPKGADLLIGTQVKDDTVLENSTKSFSVDALGSYIVTSTSGITGSGTLNTIAMFTPNGKTIGNSGITQSSPEIIKIGTGIAGGASVLETNLLTCNTISGANLLTIQGNSIIGNEAADLLTVNSTSRFYNGVQLGSDTDDQIAVEGTLELQGPVKDHSANLPSSTGQILVGNTSGVVTWTDSTSIVSGAIAKLIPFQVTASAGGSSTYSANNNIVEIGWTGGNGTYVLNIPSASAIPYRNIRFVTNSTFPNGASDKVQITAQSGETIDGAAFFEISKQYEGVSLWSNGTEWIVIQAKAH
jgi:hypothetical protein